MSEYDQSKSRVGSLGMSEYDQSKSRVGSLGMSEYDQSKSRVGSLGMPEYDQPKVDHHYEPVTNKQVPNSMMDCSFVSVLDDISASDNTLDICKKVIDKNTYKLSQMSNAIDDVIDFEPSLNSTEILAST